MEESYDAIIIGAGVAGALAAWRLAGASHRVLILEAGERGPDRVDLVGAYAMATRKTAGSPYKGGEGATFAPSPDTEADYEQTSDKNSQYRSFYTRRVGGSTWHFLGNVPRFVPNDFRMRSVYGAGVDWPLEYEDLEPWYCEAEREIGVSGDHDEWNGLLGAFRSRPFPMSKIWQSYSDRVVIRALESFSFEGKPLKILSTPQARNSQPYDDRPVCAGNSTCVPICPIQAKYDATVHVAKAERAGAELREKSVVVRLEVGEDRRISAVVYKTYDGREHRVTGRVIVLSAHAIESPKLLLMSASERVPDGVANSSGQVGRNLMDHLQGAGAALLRQPVFPFRGPPTTSGIDAFRDGEFRRTQSAFRMSLGNDGWGRLESPYRTLRMLVNERKLFGRELKAAVEDRITRQFRISYSTEMLPDAENRVTLSAEKKDALGVPRAHIVTRVPEYNKLGFEMAWRVMDQIFQTMHAEEIRLPTDRNEYSGAGHIMGTCRMGDDPKTSVVDAWSRAHDHPNLYILGSSVFPTGGTANPTLTLAALALRTAERLREILAGRGEP